MGALRWSARRERSGPYGGGADVSFRGRGVELSAPRRGGRRSPRRHRRGPRLSRGPRRHCRLPSPAAAGGGRGRQRGGGRGGVRFARESRATLVPRFRFAKTVFVCCTPAVGRTSPTVRRHRSGSAAPLQLGSTLGGTYVNADRSAIAGPLVLDEAEAFSVAELLEEPSRVGARRRVGSSGERLPAADIAGIPSPSSSREALIGAGVSPRPRLSLRGVAPGLDRRRQALRALRQRRGARGPFDGGRVRRRLPPGHDRRLDPVRRRLAHGLWTPELAELVFFWGAGVGSSPRAARPLARSAVRRSRTSRTRSSSGPETSVSSLARKLLKHPEYGINLVGFVDASPKAQRPDLEHLTLLGPAEELADIVCAYDVERVVIGSPTNRTRIFCGSSARSRAWPCRSTSSRGSSRSSDQASRSTRSRDCR